MGMIMPNMGIVKSAPVSKDKVGPATRRSLADALFSSTRQRVLGLLFGQPQRSFFATEIINRVGAGSGAVQRELQGLEESGLVTVARVGNQKHYQANASAPIYAELCSLIRKTVGLAEPVRQALEPARDRIDLALLYGSVAKGQDSAASDIDVLLVSDALTLENVFQLLEGAEKMLARKISPTLYTKAEFQRRRRNGNSFLKSVLEGESVVLMDAINDEP